MAEELGYRANTFASNLRRQKSNTIGVIVPRLNSDFMSRVIEPAMTTVTYPAREMGEVAVTNLINHLNGSSNIHATNTIILRSDLIVRDSTLKK